MTTVSLPRIEEGMDVRGVRVVVRASLNAPITDGVVQNEFRIREALPTLVRLQKAGARVVLLAHVGRDPEASLLPVFEVLKKHIPLTWCGQVVGDEVEQAISALQDGDVVMLENVRSHSGEEENDESFARTLASYGDIYVNDAFSDSHRAHASIVGVPAYIPGYFGETFLKEYEELGKAMMPETPSLFMLGGAKFETKVPLIERYGTIYDHVFVGGALANDIYKARGLNIGRSLVSEVTLPTSLVHHERIIVPVDVVVKNGEGSRVVLPENVQDDDVILDAGPETVRMLAPFIKEAKTILWNGPFGDFEHGFSDATNETARLVGESDAYSIIGGGDTVSALSELQIEDQFGFVSTAGGAMLTFLAEGTLVGIEAVRGKKV